MPEYVYALHDFQPEHDDEVPFRAGERIEVVEKDDMYGDGWWQGRNLAGKVGLFPQSYTSSTPPSSDIATGATSSSDSTIKDDSAVPSPSALQPLHEESENESSPLNGNESQSQAPAIYINGNSPEPGTEPSMMRATMTDVQQAIEQLGRPRSNYADEDRSFSFASSQHNTDTEHDGDEDTDFDISDADGDNVEDVGEWHKGARKRLAEKARKAVEEAEKLEAMMGERSKAPPIPVELSDESEEEMEEDEDDLDFTKGSSYIRRHSRIPEEDEEEEEPYRPRSPIDEGQAEEGDSLTVPESLKEENEAQTATATRTTFPVPMSEAPEPEPEPAPAALPVSQPAPGIRPLPAQPGPPPEEVEPVNRVSLPTPTSPGFSHLLSSPSPSSGSVSASTVTATGTGTPTPTAPSPVPAPLSSAGSPAAALSGLPTDSKQKHDSVGINITGLPSPTGTSSTGTGTPAFQFSQSQSSANSVSSINGTAPSSSVITTPTADISKETPSTKEGLPKDPSTWSVSDVLTWLRERNLADPDICEKFSEQDISGDVLLDLDVNVLKNEIGIMAFGKRVRIANAIGELKKSLEKEKEGGYAESTSTGGLGLGSIHGQSTNASQPGTPIHAAYTQYALQAPGSPSPQLFAAQSPHSVHSAGSFPHGHSRNQSQAQSHHSFPGSLSGGAFGGEFTASPMSAGGMLGTEGEKRLSASPSDSALGVSGNFKDDEHGALSEGEGISTAASQRRRLFGRSHDSAASEGRKSSRHSRDSKDEYYEKEEEEKSKEKDAAPTPRHRAKKNSIDGGKSTGEGGGNRLSIFGGTFAGSLGKQRHRKPPPRYSSLGEDAAAEAAQHDAAKDKDKSSSSFHLPKFSTGPRKASAGSARPGSSSGLQNKFKNEGVSEKKEKEGKEKEVRDPTLLRKRTSSYPGPTTPKSPRDKSRDEKRQREKSSEKDREEEKEANGHGEKGPVAPLKPGQSILDQIGEPEHSGWMRKKGDRYNSWKLRYFVLKGQHMYCLKSDSHSETKIKGYINIVGYKVTVDENVNPGKYGFRIDHDHDKTHYFSSDEKNIIRDWMKAIMKATIGRDYTKPVISSFSAPTIPLMVAQAMNPAPRPPSPTARDATQKAMRRENPNQLSSRDARILMGLPGSDSKEERTRLDSFFTTQSVNSDASKDASATDTKDSASAKPPRPSRELRRGSTSQSIPPTSPTDEGLFEWANTHLPASLQINGSNDPICGGLTILRIAESIKGRPSSPPVPDSAFPRDLEDDKLEGLFKLFDFLLDNDVKMGSVSINDVRMGKRDKIIQLLKALKAWEDKRRALVQSFGRSTIGGQAGPFIASTMA